MWGGGRFRHGHGWGGPGGPWGGPGGPFGGPFKHRHGRLFERGDLKYVILDLLKDRPRHGYDVIQELESRFRGFYSPSAGSVYPTLQLLEDQGYVTSTQQDGKRVYAITDEGRRFLADREDVVQGIRDRMGAGWGPKAHPEVAELMQEVQSLGRLLFQQATRGALRDPEKVRQLRDVVHRARTEIETIFGGAPETFV
jgi:DNA-binding PadR family transcriptional regulator